MRKGEVVSQEIKELKLVEITETIALNEVGILDTRIKYSLVDLDGNIIIDDLDLRKLK